MTVPGTTERLLGRAHSPGSINRIHAEKIQHRKLFLKPSQQDSRELRRQKRNAAKPTTSKTITTQPKPLSARQRRRLGLYDIDKVTAKYSSFVPLHQLWCGYMRDLLGNDLHAGGPPAALKIAGADFHGAYIEVTRSVCLSRVGIAGVVVRDTRHAFEVINKKDKIKLIPKEGTVFSITVPCDEAASQGTAEGAATNGAQGTNPQKDCPAGMTFEVLGDQFKTRAADRATKKFKWSFLENI